MMVSLCQKFMARSAIRLKGFRPSGNSLLKCLGFCHSEDIKNRRIDGIARRTDKGLTYERVYFYPNAPSKVRMLFRLNMLYIYGNSALLFMEVLNPLEAGSNLHSLILSVSLFLGVGVFSALNSLISRTVREIHYCKQAKSMRLHMFNFAFKEKAFQVEETDITNSTISNIENFHFFRIRTFRQKFYINLLRNGAEIHRILVNDLITKKYIDPDDSNI